MGLISPILNYLFHKFQFVELIKSALLYGASPVCVLRETEHPGHLNVRGVLRHCVPRKGLYPLHLYLPQILMGEHIHFEVNQDKAFQNIVIEYRVNIEICLSG